MTIEGNRADIRLWTIMRGIAALAVVLFHFRVHLAYPLDGAPLIGAVIRNGDLGVDMFFTLSGFVMTYVYGLPSPGTRFDYRSFYVRRLARIYPVHFVTLIGAFVMLTGGAMLGLARVDMGKLLVAIPVQLLLLHGIGTDIAPTLNYPSWSVSSEMFAYLLFPLFALVYSMLRSPAPLVLAALGMLYVMMDATSLAAIGAIRVSTEFILGMGLCLMLRERRHRAIGLGAMMLGAAGFVATVSLSGPRSVAIAALAVAIGGAFVGHREGPARWPVAALSYLGRISYSIYMVHALVEAPGFKIAQIVTGAPEDRNSLWALAAMIMLTILAAAILYHLVEQPCRRAVVALAERRMLCRASS